MKAESSNYNPEELLSVPQKMEGEQVERAAETYNNLSKKFAVWGKKDMSRQYCLIYAARLEKMRPLVEARARGKWGTCWFFCSISVATDKITYHVRNCIFSDDIMILFDVADKVH